MKFCIKMLLSSALTVSTVIPSYSYAGEGNCFVPQVDTKLYKAGDKIKISVPLNVKNPNIPENPNKDPKQKEREEKYAEHLNAQTRGEVYFAGTRLRSNALLKYNPTTKAMEGEIVVPKELRTDASLRVDLEKYLPGGQRMQFRMSSPQDFQNPNIKTGKEKPTPPIIKMGKVEVSKTPPSQALARLDGKAMANVPEYLIKGSFTVAYSGALKEKFNGKDKYSTGISVKIKDGNSSHGGYNNEKCKPKNGKLECTFELPIDYATSGDETLVISAGDYLDRTEVSSNKDFKLNIPSTVVDHAKRAEVKSTKATLLPNGKLRVETQIENGVSKDRVYASIIYFQESKESRGDRASLGQLTCLSNGACSGEFEMPKFNGKPTRFEISTEVGHFQFANKYDSKSFPVSAGLFTKAEINQSYGSSNYSSDSRILSPREVCGVVGGVQIGSMSSGSSGGGAAAAAPPARVR